MTLLLAVFLPEFVLNPITLFLPAMCVLQGSELWVHLSHPWCDCSVAVGDKANIIGGTRTVDAEGRMHAYMNHGNGMFVLHPDVLLSGRVGSVVVGVEGGPGAGQGGLRRNVIWGRND